jgi:hypothetical protein
VLGVLSEQVSVTLEYLSIFSAPSNGGFQLAQFVE